MNRNTHDGRGDGVTPPLPDDDIAALFEAQADRVTAPSDLDVDILAAARAVAPGAVSEDTADRSEADPARRTRTDRARPQAVRYRSPPRWLAAAAVVVLALALVPLVRQAPESREVSSVDARSSSQADVAVVDEAERAAPSEIEEEAADDASHAAPVAESLAEAAPTARRKATPAPASAPASAPVPDAAPRDAEATAESASVPAPVPNVTEADADAASEPAPTSASAPSAAPADADATADASVPAEADLDVRNDARDDAGAGMDVDAEDGSGSNSSADVGAAAEADTDASPDSSRETRSTAIAPRPSILLPRRTDGISSFANTDRAPVVANDPFEGHRRTPSAWLERLRERLRTDGLTPALEAEYRRFRSKHPDVEPAFDPERVALEGEADQGR